MVAIALAAMAALAGCEAGTETAPETEPGTETEAEGGTGNGTPDGAEQLTDSRWLPEQVTVDGTEHPRPPGLTLVHLDLPDAEEFLDEFGCRYGSDVTVSGDTLLVDEVIRTDAGCAGDEDTFEENFLDVFQGSLTYEIDDEDGPGMNDPATLTLTNPAGGTITLTEDLPIPLPTT
ncbi:META domain-containing protein [Streptomyces sp. DSM 41886]|uniref:META domain-containing protein n=1 Tax=Streptomyces johnsoniae TaxID=3075532 RepID=A0ABU2S8G7_9ACTN|nr:META domain-containing protein [Streptomyces sp. DSM 41886]